MFGFKGKSDDIEFLMSQWAKELLELPRVSRFKRISQHQNTIMGVLTNDLLKEYMKDTELIQKVLKIVFAYLENSKDADDREEAAIYRKEIYSFKERMRIFSKWKHEFTLDYEVSLEELALTGDKIGSLWSLLSEKIPNH